jgi:hypothetical protein
MVSKLTYTAGKLTGTTKLVEYDHFAELLLAEGPVHCSIDCTDHRVIVSYGKVISVVPIIVGGNV